MLIVTAEEIACNIMAKKSNSELGEIGVKPGKRSLAQRLVPGFIAALLRRRAMRVELEATLIRLAETSPHLLKDIGIGEGLWLDDPTPEAASAGLAAVPADPRRAVAAPQRVILTPRRADAYA